MRLTYDRVDNKYISPVELTKILDRETGKHITLISRSGKLPWVHSVSVEGDVIVVTLAD